MIAYLQLLALVALAAGVLKINRRIKHMSPDEKAAFDSLTASVKRLENSHHDLAVENGTLKAENESLKAQLAAVPPPVPDDSAEVIAAANALASEVNAELDPPPAAVADPNAPPAS